MGDPALERSSMKGRRRLRTADFDYVLPPELVAQAPAARREASRLLVYDRSSGRIAHRLFSNIIDYLGAGSLLVVNDTKVIPARLRGKKRRTGGKVEILLLGEGGGGLWECLLKPARRMREGKWIVFEGRPVTARIEKRTPGGTFLLSFGGTDDLAGELDRIGRVPLPPYIRAESGGRVRGEAFNRRRYQTVYARRPGAVAAPTAGLHFSEELLRALEACGVEIVPLTLHVSLGSFLPVREEFVDEHRLHAEYFEIGEKAAERINKARREARLVVVVGTTAARALETAAGSRGEIVAARGRTELFIYPPYRFKVVRNLLTNFHLPRSTLLMLVAALVGREKMLRLYEEAKREGYRFLSWGDAMLIGESIPGVNAG